MKIRKFAEDISPEYLIQDLASAPLTYKQLLQTAALKMESIEAQKIYELFAPFLSQPSGDQMYGYKGYVYEVTNKNWFSKVEVHKYPDSWYVVTVCKKEETLTHTFICDDLEGIKLLAEIIAGQQPWEGQAKGRIPRSIIIT